MFEWILIAFVIALIFGVIKVEQFKSVATKIEDKASKLIFQAKAWADAKTSEIKAAADKKAKAEETAKKETQMNETVPEKDSSEENAEQ